MTVAYAACVSDSWYSLVNDGSDHNYGNGSGVRLLVGYSTADGGATTYKNRAGLSFSDWPRDDSKTYSEVLLRLRVKAGGSCWAKGSAPNLWVERTSAQTTVTENGNADDCTVSSAGAAAARWPGPTTTTTNRVAWSGTPLANDVIEINVTQMWLDWYATRGYGTNDNFTVVLKANNETATSNRIPFFSRHNGSFINTGGDNPELKLTYTWNQTPSIPSVSLTPTGRISGATTPTMSFDFTDPDGEQCYQCYVQVSTDNTFASVTHWDSGWVTPTTASGGRATKTYGGTALTRGVQYYWRVNVRDDDLAASGYSAAVAFDVNEYPVGTKVTP